MKKPQNSKVGKEPISYENDDWGISNINAINWIFVNRVIYAVMCINKYLLPMDKKTITRILKNESFFAPIFGMSGFFSSLPRFATNIERDEERVKSQKGRFVWEYLY